LQGQPVQLEPQAAHTSFVFTHVWLSDCRPALVWPGAGGLPPGWLGTNKVFRRVQYIDLSGNSLGHTAWPPTDANRYENAYGVDRHWCLAGRTPASGWCPRAAGSNAALSPLAGMPGLLHLDVSDNGFQGEG
jgi:hypothetical protein